MLLNNRNILTIKVTGNSMRPFVKSGDYVLIKRCALSQTVIGDIIAVVSLRELWKDTILSVHRLIWKKYTRFITKGDSISFLERLNIGKDVKFIGKVISIIRGNKIISADNQRDNFIKLIISISLIPLQIIRRH